MENGSCGDVRWLWDGKSDTVVAAMVVVERQWRRKTKEFLQQNLRYYKQNLRYLTVALIGLVG